MAYHSNYNSKFNGRVACGLPLIPFRTKLEGPGNQPFQFNELDIVDEAFHLFRVNVLFKNFEIKGPGDKVLVYLLVLLTHLFKSTENIKEKSIAAKKLAEINALRIPGPRQQSDFLINHLTDGNNVETDAYLQYIKQIRTETINRFLNRFYQQDLPIDDFKFWTGLAKKKFMNLNYGSMF